MECEGLAQRYGRHYVFRNFDMVVQEGITVLLGPNGAGKTTLLEMIATLRPPSAGKLTVLGLDVDGNELAAIRRSTGFLPQALGYYGRFTAQEFVEYAAWLKGVPSGKLRDVARTALDRVGLSDASGKRMSALSGGMLRRAGIAQAIAHRPKFVILDEPTGGLDPGQRIGFRKMIKKMSTGASFLISTHLVDDLRALADDVVVLSNGRTVFRGTPGDLEARGTDRDPGDSGLERGYSNVLQAT